MNESIFSIKLGDIKISAGLPENGLGVRDFSPPLNALAQLKMIHRHSMYELFFVPDGELWVHTVDGSVSYQRSIVIVPPYFDHYVVHREGSEGYSCIYFSWEKTPETGQVFSALCQALEKGVTALPISEDEIFYFSHLESAENDREQIEHLLALLMREIFHRLVPPDRSSVLSSQKYGKYINIIEAYLAKHYTENISLSDLAEELYLCTKQVARIIRREYGCSLSDLVNRQRLAAACMLLKYTALDIKEVATQVGYEYENYFYTRFRKQYGVTPKQFREKCEER